ncbi:MAG: hypothetical protein ACR2QC_09065, partial [Gammaproteobacteria bacterium]
FKKVWATMDRAAEERRRERAEDDARLKQWSAEFKEQIKEISRNIGGFTNSYGAALEDEFLAAVQEAKRVGDIALEDVRRVKNRFEYDVFGSNGGCVVVGEVKHKLDLAEVRHFAEERLPYFAKDFPGEAKGRKVLGMVGGNHITARARAEAEKRGLIILRLRNKKLVVENDSNARPIAQV